MTAQEAIEIFTGHDDHEKNHRDGPLMAKAFDEIRGSFEIPAPFHKWLIALGCPDYGGALLEAAKVTSSLFVGLLECARIHWADSDPEWHSETMRELIGFAKPVDEQLWLMRQAIAAIEETLEQSASTDSMAEDSSAS